MRKRVLVCDDDQHLRSALRLLLEKSYDVLEAASGEEALAMLGKERIELVLLDVTMPGLSGLETLSRYHGSEGATQTIMLTTHQEIDVARRALEAGASEFVTKPFDAEALLAHIERLLGDERADASGRPWRVDRKGGA